MLKAEIVSIKVCVPLTVEQFQHFEKFDFLNVVKPLMEAEGASEIEYNGHFGPNVFFTVERQFYISSVKRVIAELLKEEPRC